MKATPAANVTDTSMGTATYTMTSTSARPSPMAVSFYTISSDTHVAWICMDTPCFDLEVLASIHGPFYSDRLLISFETGFIVASLRG
jgi:hypothetical protein